MTASSSKIQNNDSSAVAHHRKDVHTDQVRQQATRKRAKAVRTHKKCCRCPQVDRSAADVRMVEDTRHESAQGRNSVEVSLGCVVCGYSYRACFRASCENAGNVPSITVTKYQVCRVTI